MAHSLGMSVVHSFGMTVLHTNICGVTIVACCGVKCFQMFDLFINTCTPLK